MDACSVLVPALIYLLPVTGKVRANTVEYFDKKIFVTERVLDRTICEPIAEQQSPDKAKLPTMNAEQKAQAIRQAAFREKDARKAMTGHCSHSVRLTLAETAQCNLMKRLARD